MKEKAEVKELVTNYPNGPTVERTRTGRNVRVFFQTYVYRVLEAMGNYDAMYNENVLNLVADKQVLARILWEIVEEFHDLDIGTIMASLDDPQVRRVRLEPGVTNVSGTKGSHGEENISGELGLYGKASLKDSADIVQNEGAVYFDIRGNAFLEAMSFKLLYDAEPQRDAYESSLGYPVENRMVFYGARLISSQKDTEFFGEDYGNIKKCVTIWLIPLSGKKEDGSIEVLEMAPRTIYGKPTGMLKGGLLKGVLIGFRKGKKKQESGNRLIGFLEDLLGDDPLEIKKEKLEKEHGMVMKVEMERKVRKVCNYASLIREEAEADGRALGREEGRLETMLESVKSVMQSLGMSLEQAMDVLKIKENDREYVSSSIKN